MPLRHRLSILGLCLLCTITLTACDSINERRARREANKAVKLIKSESYHGATKLLRKAVQLNPKDANARFLLGWVLHKRGQTNEAIKEYERSVLFDGSNYRPQFELGNLYYHIRNYNKAVKHYEKALALKAGHVKSMYHLALAYHKAKRFDDAIRLYQRTIAQQPKALLSSSYYGMATVYFDQAQAQKEDIQAQPMYQKAVDIVRVAIGKQQASLRLYNLLGLIYQAQQKYPEALAIFKKAKTIAPKKGITYYNIGNTYDRWLKELNLKLKDEKDRRKKVLLLKERNDKLKKALDAFKEYKQLKISDPGRMSAVRAKIMRLELMEEKEREKRLRKRQRRRRRR